MNELTGEYSFGDGGEYKPRDHVTHTPTATATGAPGAQQEDPLTTDRDKCAKFERPAPPMPPQMESIASIEARLSNLEVQVGAIRDNRAASLANLSTSAPTMSPASAPTEYDRDWYCSTSQTIELTDLNPVQLVTGLSQKFLACLTPGPQPPGCDATPRSPPSYSWDLLSSCSFKLIAPKGRTIRLTWYAFDLDPDLEFLAIVRPGHRLTWITGSLSTLASFDAAFASDQNGGVSISAPGNGTDTNFHLTMSGYSGLRWSYGGFCATVSIECPNGKVIQQGSLPGC